jgi:hypothetical protein
VIPYPEPQCKRRNPDRVSGAISAADSSNMKLADSAAVTDALSRCVKVVRGGRSALLHVRVTPI